jgi:glycosyltransferase involved in cell wall biosynthesis
VTRVGFALAGRTVGWMASWTYYRTLLRAILADPGCGIEPVVFLPSKADHPLIDELPELERHRVAMLDDRSPGAALRAAWRGPLLCDRPFGRLLERHEIAVLSHSGHLGRYRGVPALGWVPDLQHRHLPELFDRRTLTFREQRYRLLARFATHLVVSSEAGARDLIDLSPRAAGKTSVLRFVIDPVPRAEQPDRGELAALYGIDGPFLYLPNQFWAHKNHRLVIDALALLRSRGRPVRVVATGAPVDRRRPEHYGELLAHVRAAGVEDDFRVLGVVPYPHVAALVRESVALINPSRFEGWSTTVEEARSVGTRVLLSSIPVHREQNPPGGEFFDPADAEGLAALMWEAWTRADPEADRRLREEAEAALPERRREFARTYAAAVRATLDAAGPSREAS